MFHAVLPEEDVGVVQRQEIPQMGWILSAAPIPKSGDLALAVKWKLCLVQP